MARQSYYHDPARKHIETYQDFSGGLNVVSSNDNTADTELTRLVNADIGDRGSIKRRNGFKATVIPNGTGTPQMISRLYRSYMPYNLLGVEGSFEGALTRSGDVMKVGAWTSFKGMLSEVVKDQRSTGNTVAGIKATPGSARASRALYLNFNGLKPNTYYALIVDYKTDGAAIGRIGVRDQMFPETNVTSDLVVKKELTAKPVTWTTVALGFKTHEKMYEARAYIYNMSPVGQTNIIHYDNVRIYEIEDAEYKRINSMTSTELNNLYPYKVGRLRVEDRTETVVAIGGKFYVNNVLKPVEGNPTIQSTRIMEAAQYGDVLFIASGSGFLVYNGATISPVVPYKPSPLEELYIGTNGLIPNPFDVSDDLQDVVQVVDVKFSHRYGITNTFITISVGVARPTEATIQYKFERRNVLDKQGYWFVLSDWSDSHKTTFITDVAGEFQFKISVRKKGTTAVLEEYIIPKYIIKPTKDDKDRPIDGNTMDLCNRILVHWDRIILYGDDDKPDVIYISDLQNPAYFPMNNTLWFENPRKEMITSVVRFRDNLVVFTPSSIQALYGTNPDDFRRVMLNPAIGCIADRGAAVAKNHIIFPSYEGIALLKSIGMSEDRANVELIDGKIKTLVERDEKLVAYVRDNQYCIVFPGSRKQLRYYYEWGVWAQDSSTSLDFYDVIVESGKVTALGDKGRILQDGTDYADEGKAFEVEISTKNLFFGETYAFKKTREVQVMFDTPTTTTNVTLRAWADERMLKESKITLLPNEEIYKMNIAGKGISVKVDLIHAENKPFRLDGFGFVFKLKNP